MSILSMEFTRKGIFLPQKVLQLAWYKPQWLADKPKTGHKVNPMPPTVFQNPTTISVTFV